MTDENTAQSLATEGKSAYELEEFGKAAEAFLKAEEAYKNSGDEGSAAEMANNRSVALLQGGQSEAALDAVAGTAEIFAKLEDPKRQAMALGNQAAALTNLGKKEEAEKLYWESASLLKTLGETDLRASVLQSISRLQLGSGRYMEAMASMESGLDEVKKPSFSQKILKRLIKIPGKMIKPKT
jgi:tetratricopeptide (TPR) repeat protein